jgi:hypothetical protein
MRSKLLGAPAMAVTGSGAAYPAAGRPRGAAAPRPPAAARGGPEECVKYRGDGSWDVITRAPRILGYTTPPRGFGGGGGRRRGGGGGTQSTLFFK